jgi:hypothetical protein
MLVSVLTHTLLFDICCIIRVRNDLDGLPHVPKGYVRVPLTAAAASQRAATPYKFERIEVRIVTLTDASYFTSAASTPVVCEEQLLSVAECSTLLCQPSANFLQLHTATVVICAACLQ